MRCLTAVLLVLGTSAFLLLISCDGVEASRRNLNFVSNDDFALNAIDDEDDGDDDKNLDQDDRNDDNDDDVDDNDDDGDDNDDDGDNQDDDDDDSDDQDDGRDDDDDQDEKDEPEVYYYNVWKRYCERRKYVRYLCKAFYHRRFRHPCCLFWSKCDGKDGKKKSKSSGTTDMSTTKGSTSTMKIMPSTTQVPTTKLMTSTTQGPHSTTKGLPSVTQGSKSTPTAPVVTTTQKVTSGGSGGIFIK